MFSLSHTRVPNSHINEYEELKVNTNFHKIMIAGVVVLLIQIFALVSNMIQPFTSHAEIMGAYLRFYKLSIVFNILLLVLGHVLRFKKSKDWLLRAFVYLYAFYQFFWAAGVALADQFQGEEIVVYYSLLFVFAIVLDIETVVFTGMVVLNHVIFFLLLTVYERYNPIDLGLRSSSIQIVMFVLFVRIYLHELLRKNFIQRKVLEETNKELQYFSNYDTLTNLYNRRKWESEYGDYFTQASENKVLLGIVMVDVDAFKEYNDNYGHVKGDQVLREVGQVIKTSTNDLHGCAGRFGGDEFIIMFLKSSENEIEAFKILIEEKVDALEIEHEFSNKAKRLQITTGSHLDFVQAEDTMWSFVAKADEDLYRGKMYSKN